MIMFTHAPESALVNTTNRFIENEGLFKVTGSYIHCSVVLSRKRCMTGRLLLQTTNDV